MQKIILILSIFFLSLSVFSQKATTLLSKDFSTGIATDGWTIDDMASQWSSSSSSKAGGTAPEARLKWVSGTHTSHLISPSVDLTGYSTVIFSFKHYLDNYSNGYTIGVATRSGGGNWNTVWSVNPSADIGPETKDILISNADVGASDFQIAIFMDGNWYNFNYWYIDDIQLYAPDNDDVSLSAINLAPYVQTGDINVSTSFQNTGNNNVTSLDISYQLNSDPVVTETISGINLSILDSYDYTFTTPLNIPSSVAYNLKVWTNLTGDQDNTNDTLNMNISGVSSIPVKHVLGEEAGGTWCGWCPRGLVALKDLAHYHPDDWIGIAVHNGDPMTVSAYDAALTAFTGGGWPNGTVNRIDAVDPGSFEAVYNTEKSVISPIEMLIENLTWDENSRTINFDVKANFVTELTGTFKLNAVITEDDVTGTASSWGQHNYYSSQSQNINLIDWEGINWKNLPATVLANEMTYNHVARAILGGWDGTDNSVPNHVVDGDNAVYSYSYTVPADQKVWDLSFIGFIVDSNSGHILNAVKVESPVPPPANVTFNPENGTTDVNLSSNIVLTFDNSMRKIDDSEIVDADISSFVSLTDPSKGTIAYTGTVNAEKTIITLNPNSDLPELTDITVTVAGNSIENEYNQVLSEATATFTTKSTVGISENINNYKISPNPAQNFIHISGLAHAKIVLTNISGKQVLTQVINSDNEQINIQNYSPGIYILKIISGKNIFTEKIIKK